MRVVLDTNILVSALRSIAGPCHALVRAIPSTKFQPVLSVPLFNEYLDVLHRPGLVASSLTSGDIDKVCDHIAAHASQHLIHYLWRTILPDPKDDHVLEVAVAAAARYVITRNVKDFGPAESFGISAIEPAKFIHLIGGLP